MTDSPHNQFPVGAVVVIARASAINRANEIGVVYEHYRIGHDGISIIFEGGGYDGFSPRDLEAFGVSRIAADEPIDTGAAKYRYRTANRLQADFQTGKFAAAFAWGRARLQKADRRRH